MYFMLKNDKQYNIFMSYENWIFFYLNRRLSCHRTTKVSKNVFRYIRKVLRVVSIMFENILSNI